MRTNDRDTAIAALARLDSERVDQRDAWLKVGMILHKVFDGGNAGLEAWTVWSEQSEKFRPGECDRLWEGFDDSGELGLGTLVMWAKRDAPHLDGGSCPKSPTRSGPPPYRPKRITKPPKPLNSVVSATARAIGAQVVARWPYCDASGREVAWVVRFDFSDGTKTFRPFSRDGSGWKQGDPDGLWPLYRLNELLDAERVFLTEGEKASDAARSLGPPATTSAHGAQSPGKTDWSYMAGKTVVILPDNDHDGQRYAEKVTGILAGLSPCCTVKIVHLPDLPEKGDIVQFIEARKGAGLSDDAIRAEIEALAEAAETVELRPATVNDAKFLPFPTDAFPQPLRWFVEEGADAIGCDPSYVALPLLSSLAAAIGNTRRIELKRGYVEPCIVWTAVVGESGTKKSPPLDLVLQAVRERQRRAFHEWRIARKAYDAAYLR